MTYIIFLIIVIGEGRGERRKSPGTKGRNLPNSCLASPIISITQKNTEVNCELRMQRWMPLMPILAKMR